MAFRAVFFICRNQSLEMQMWSVNFFPNTPDLTRYTSIYISKFLLKIVLNIFFLFWKVKKLNYVFILILLAFSMWLSKCIKPKRSMSITMLLKKLPSSFITNNKNSSEKTTALTLMYQVSHENNRFILKKVFQKIGIIP